MKDTRELVDCTEQCVTSLSCCKGKRPGFCVDTGAPSSVIGLKELRRIANVYGRRLIRLRKSLKRFRFADASFNSLGQVEIPLATPGHLKPIYVNLDVVSADVPALLGLDILDTESLFPDTAMNQLTKKIILDNITDQDGKFHAKFPVEEWSIPLMRHYGHIYVAFSFPSCVYFSITNLQKIHRQFAHTTVDKLYQLLKRARPEETTAETFEILKDLVKRCDPYQRIQNAPTRFRIRFGAEIIRLNERLLIDIMYFDGKPVQHIVDEGTHFSSARFIDDMSTKNIWATTLECWATIYIGLPRKILVDQGTQLGDLFVSLGALNNFEVQQTEIQAHNSLGLGERYHQPLRNTYRKVRTVHPNQDKKLLLSFAAKAMNDTLGTDGLVSSALVFGEFPPEHTRSEMLHRRAEMEYRAEVANMARREMEKQIAKVRIKRALSTTASPAADKLLEVGPKVLI